jgi:ASC-1-like (ASCH) protein
VGSSGIEVLTRVTREEQLANIRQIYPPEREALGVVAIGIELVDPPRASA